MSQVRGYSGYFILAVHVINKEDSESQNSIVTCVKIIVEISSPKHYGFI